MHSSAGASTSALRALQADVAARDAEIGRLQKDLGAARKRLQALQVGARVACSKVQLPSEAGP